VPDSLLLRPGCRFECHGDGTCCTNIHVIGPLNNRDAARVREAGSIVFPTRRTVVRKDPGLERLVVVQDAGACVFLDEDVRCRIHGSVGPQYKPAPCRRFPVGAAGTPAGVRVTLSHRCACVSVGRSALLQEDKAREILVSPWSGRLERDHAVGERLRWRGRTRVLFDDYLPWERSMLASLDCDDGPALEEVLGMAGDDELSPLRSGDWSKVADTMARWTRDEPFGDGFSCTLRWAEGVIRNGRDWQGPFPKRPWGWTFERAALRQAEQGSARRIYGSWLADELWSLTWATRSSLYTAMADMASRYVLAKRMAAGLQRLGARGDVAAAESVMIADTLGAWDSWARVRGRMQEPAEGVFG
jgi:Fe-S-cluster containining protein